MRERPHYFTLGPCPWLLEWYREGRALRVPLADLDPATVSFTYGDTFPAMRYGDGKPYRGQVYILGALPALVAEHGLPQTRNPDGALGPDRYIEAQVWDDAPLLHPGEAGDHERGIRKQVTTHGLSPDY